jgi:FkbM family methyltransferase
MGRCARQAVGRGFARAKEDVMRKLVKDIAGRFGIEIRRVKRNGATAAAARSYPYVESFAMDDVRFDYWVTDDTYRTWYNPDAQSKWCINEGYLKFVRKSDKILEIGCNAGFTTCLLSRAVGNDGLVVGLDIIPSNCMVSEAQIGLNRITNTQILHLGAGDFNGKIRVNNQNNGTVQTGEAGGIEVDVTRCDELMKEYGSFDVLKVDVEGFESQVFKGAAELMSKRPRLLLEIHGAEVEKYGSSYEELFALFGADRYEGLMCVDPNGSTATNVLEPFDPTRLLRERVHGNLFLQPKA